MYSARRVVRRNPATDLPQVKRKCESPQNGMEISCGIDWAEAHHDVALVDEHGTELARMRIGDDAAGYRALVNLLVARN
jgi:hypothetical protein